MKKIVGFGEIMIRLKCMNGLRFRQNKSFDIGIAGAEGNTLILLSRLGLKCTLVTALPFNDLGDFIMEELQKNKLDIQYILQDNNRVGLYFVEDGNQVRPTQVIYDRKNSSFASLNENSFNWDDIFIDTKLFHWTGVSVAISDAAMQCCKKAIQTATDKKIPISCDFNYRKLLWYYEKTPQEIMPPLIQYANYVFADFDSLQIYLNINTNSQDNFINRLYDAYIQLKKYIPNIKTLAMTFRNSNNGINEYLGGLVYNDICYQSPNYIIPNITDSIGAGDAFAGGIIYGLLHNFLGQEIINFGTVCGVLKHSIHGDWALINKNEIDYTLQNGLTTKIIR